MLRLSQPTAYRAKHANQLTPHWTMLDLAIPMHSIVQLALSRLAERGDLTVVELASISGHRTLQMLQKYTHLQT